MLRVLFLSDTHLGFDLPVRPRTDDRRRGVDFFENTSRALDVAIAQGVDLVVHGGDVFHRSCPPPAVVDRAYELLLRPARAGIPTVVVAGNHERGRLPPSLLFHHQRLFVLDHPRTLFMRSAGVKLDVCGFGYHKNIAEVFPSLGACFAPPRAGPSVRLMVFHHAVEGATVGPHHFVFRDREDTINAHDLPVGFAAFLSGHIHRRQRLDMPHTGPVLYPGSVERTSTAELGEEKGFLVLTFVPDRAGGRLIDERFLPLPTRPLVSRPVPPGLSGDALRGWLDHTLSQLPPDAVVQLVPEGDIPGLSQLVRDVAPATMTVKARRPAWMTARAQS